MSERKPTFEEWSNKWDTIFKLAERDKIPFETLLKHTLMYNKEWNYKK